MIYVPYKCYVAKYESYEEEVLAAELSSIRLVSISHYFGTSVFESLLNSVLISETLHISASVKTNILEKKL